MNEIGSHVATKENTAAMLRSGTDIYMVVNDPEHNSGKDNTIRAIGSGDLTLGELQKAVSYTHLVDAFGWCSNLKSITLSDNLKTIDSEAFA